MMNGSALNIYSDIGISSEVLGASSYRQIQMLLEKLQTLLPQALAALGNNNVQEKSRWIGKAFDIVVYLRECLDFNADESLAKRLDSIYKHMEKQLFNANARNDRAALANCIEILNNLKTWWDKLDTEA